MSRPNSGKVFLLCQHTGQKSVGVVITPILTPTGHVLAAWAHAVTYSAKGLNIPDYEAALNLLKQRHPSWQVEAAEPVTIGVELYLADQDTPE